jgi:two-component system chemotaxis response regulator CheY
LRLEADVSQISGRVRGEDLRRPGCRDRRLTPFDNAGFTRKEREVKTIMLVDDSATILMSITNILTKAGYGVEKATNAGEGLNKLKGGAHVDLLITDLNMPGMNGIEFIKEVRKLSPYRFMPILFLTTESQQAKRAEAKAAGASGWLVKPATADELLSTIKLVLR